MSETCPIGTQARLDALLGGELPDEERDTLKAHLEDPCETCLDLLEAMEDEALLATAAGPAAELSAVEAEQMFEAVALPEPARTERAPASAPGLMERIVSWMRPPVLVPLAAAAVLVVAFGLSTMMGDDGKARYTGVKSVGTAESACRVELMAFAGRVENGRPVVDRRLQDGDLLKAGELVLFRYSLSLPAFVHLTVRKSTTHAQDRPDGILYSSELRSQAGEHELAADGHALALDPAKYGPEFTVHLAAYPSAMHRDDLSNITEPPTDLGNQGWSGQAVNSIRLRLEPTR